MAYADALRADTATWEDAADLIEGIFASGFPLTWTTWSPTLSASGSMTYTSTSVTAARYIQIGKMVLYYVAFTGTVGGSVSNSIRFTVPVTGVSTAEFGAGNGLDNGAYTGTVVIRGSTSRADIYRYNAANFTAGTVSLSAFGFYEVP